MAVIQRALKVRIYPTAEQKEYFEQCFGCCRFVWNQMLGDVMDYYAATGSIKVPQPTCYKESYLFLKDVDSLALCNVRLNLIGAIDKFFKEKNIGFPKFKAKKRCNNSYTTNAQRNIDGTFFGAPYKKNGTLYIIRGEQCIVLPKLKKPVKAKIHRLPGTNTELRSATISRTPSGKYYCSLLFAVDVPEPVPIVPTKENTLGLDYSSPHFFVASDSRAELMIDQYEHFYRKAQKKLRRQQKSLSRKHKMSNNYAKQRKKVAAVHEHIKNQRKDFCHKASTAIAKQYDAVCVEDINLRGMAGALKLGKSTNDNGFGMFRTFLEYKLQERGKQFIVLDRFYPSTKTCSHCGTVNPKVTLGVEEWDCPSCGVHHLRDVNAATNIRNAGLTQYFAGVPDARKLRLSKEAAA